MGTRRAIGLDDAFGQQVVYRLALRRLIGRIDMVERAVLADQQDHVLDRRERDVAAITTLAWSVQCDDAAGEARLMLTGGSRHVGTVRRILVGRGGLCADDACKRRSEHTDEERFEALAAKHCSHDLDLLQAAAKAAFD